MAYRKVAMIDINEVLRRWVSGTPKKRIAAQMDLDPKTVRRYVEVAEEKGVRAEDGLSADRRVRRRRDHRAQAAARAPHGDPWWACEAERGAIEAHLKAGLRLTKVQRLLARASVHVPYSTLHRYEVREFGFGRKGATVPVADGEPGCELQVDTGWVLSLGPDETGVRRRKKAFVFTPNVSRYRFVYPIERETTAEAIEACKAARAFYSGVYRSMIVDNKKAIVAHADRLEPQITRALREYAQTRGFFVDTARVRHRETSRGSSERSATSATAASLASGSSILMRRQRALRWCRDEYVMRRHGTTATAATASDSNASAATLLHPPFDHDRVGLGGRPLALLLDPVVRQRCPRRHDAG